MSARLIALRSAVVLAILLVALALWQMREAAQLLAVAVAISAGLAPLVNRLAGRGVPRQRAAAIVFGMGLLALLTVGVGVALLLAGDIAQAIDLLPLWYTRARETLAFQGGWIAEAAAALPTGEAVNEALLGGGESMGSMLLDMALRVVAVSALALGAAALGFFWLMDERRIARLWLSLMPVGARMRVRALGVAVYREVGIYVRGVAALVLLTSVSLLVIYKLAGLPAAALLALAGGIAQVVPLLGAALALTPAALASIVRGPEAAVGFAAAIIAIAAIRLLATPWLFKGGISVNPVLVVVMIMALFELGGPPLILLAPPLAAALQAATRALVDTGRSAAGQSRAVQIDELAERLDLVEAAGAASPDPQRVQALVERARSLLQDARRA